MQGGKQGSGRLSGVTNAFPEGRGRIPVTPLIAASVAALFKGGDRARSLIGGWSADDRGRPICQYMLDDGDEIVVSVDLHPAFDEKNGVDSEWALVEGISPLTIDVLLAVLAQACATFPDGCAQSGRPGPVRVTARAILHYKDLVQWGAEGAAMRRRIDNEIRRLNGLRFVIRRRRREGRASERSCAGSTMNEPYRLFDVCESKTVRSVRKMHPGKPETVWTIRPGRWFGVVGEDLEEVRLVPMSQLLLQLDHRRNRGKAVLAKKIGFRMSVLSEKLQPDGSLQQRICDLLEDIGELPKRDARGDRWGARMRHRFVQAVLLLKEAGVLGSVNWPVDQGSGVGGRARGWVAAWLKRDIVLHHPAAAGMSRDTSAARSHKVKRPARQSASLLELHRGSVIRSMRSDRKISQYRLARELGISAAYLSQIENEHRMASRAVLGRIASWASRNCVGTRSRPDNAGAVASLECAAGAWNKVGGGGRHSVASKFLQGRAPCGPAGKDKQT